MKYFIGSIVFAVSLCAQDSSVKATTSVNINGNRVTEGPQIDQTKSRNMSTTTERMQSINGRMVPIERVEERVLRDDAGGRVVERLIHQFDATGSPTAPIRETIDEQKRPDGGSTTQTTRYQGDINGNMRLIEKSTTEMQKSGSTESSQMVLQRPTLNGSVETVEKKDTVRVKEGTGYREDATTYRRDGNGGFGVAVRQTTEHTQQGAQASDNTAEYEIGSSGRLELHSQSVATTTTRPDGSKDSVVNIFGQNVPGTVDPTGKLKLYEQQLIETKPAGANTVVEKLSVRRPTVSDPNALGPAREISQTVCTGKCGNQTP